MLRGDQIAHQKERRETLIPEWLPAHGFTAILAKRGQGKGLPLNEPVYTPWGPKRIGDIKVGDTVCRPDGGNATVIGVYPQGVRPCYELAFEDGSTSRCDDNHLWRVHITSRETGSNGRERVLPIKSVIDLLETHRISIPTITGKLSRRGRKVRSNLDPYTLGLLLGDGSFGSQRVPSVTFCTADNELKDHLIREGFAEHKPKRGLFYLYLPRARRRFPGDKKPNTPLFEALKGMSLFGKRANDKFIPDVFFNADYESRLALLQGLLR
jgi:phosphate starvation-inducible protein PhoH and related proteins